MNVVLPTDTKAHSYCHLVTAEPPFTRTGIGYMHQTNLGREYSMLQSFYHSLIVYQVCHDVRHCVKSASCIVKPEVKSQWTVLVGCLTI